MVNCRREFVTPEKARYYLTKNTNNIRDISPYKLKQYANDMKEGRWQDNGQTITFYKSGKLFDGQHRLKAIDVSGVPQWLWIVEGVDDDIYITDIGYQRAAYQIAHVSTTAAGLAAMIIQPNGKSNKDRTKSEIIDFARQHKAFLETITRLGKKGKFSGRGKTFIPMQNGAALLALCAALVNNIASLECLEAFCECTNNGLPVDNHESSAPLMLRKMFIEGSPNSEGFLRPWSFSSGANSRDYCSIVYQAIAAFSNSQKVKRRFAPDKVDFEELRLKVLNSVDALEIKLNLVT